MRRDDGTVLIQAIGGVLLALVVTVTMFDLGSLFMSRTALMSVANDVALQASTAVDIDALYAAPIGTELALDANLASQRAVVATANVSDTRLHDIRLDDVAVSGDAVRVVVSAAVPNPLGPITGNRTMRLRAAAAASTPTRF